jgi:hypothetical protein
MEQKQRVSEQKTATASYILTFYEEVTQLTHTYSQYLNIDLQNTAKYGGDESKLDSGDKEILLNIIQSLRYYANQCFIKYQSINMNIDTTPEIAKTLETSHSNILKDFVVKKEDAKAFTIAINQFLNMAVMKDLLKTSEDVINTIYPNE